jgi:hypothetical protein
MGKLHASAMRLPELSLVIPAWNEAALLLSRMAIAPITVKRAAEPAKRSASEGVALRPSQASNLTTNVRGD